MYSLVLVPEHILVVLMAFLSGETLSWQAEYLTRHYGFAPEETGFLYFDKVPNPGTSPFNII